MVCHYQVDTVASYYLIHLLRKSHGAYQTGKFPTNEYTTNVEGLLCSDSIYLFHLLETQSMLIVVMADETGRTELPPIELLIWNSITAVVFFM